MLDTQIHFQDEVVQQIQASLQGRGETVEQFIQQAVAHELQRRKPKDLKSFFDALRPLKSFADIDAVVYVDRIRSTSRLLTNDDSKRNI